MVTPNTGVQACSPTGATWTDAQLRAVAESGGTIGIMYHSEFLGDRMFGGRLQTIVRHIEHVIHVAGEDAVSLGSDWDGSIITPRDMPTCWSCRASLKPCSTVTGPKPEFARCWAPTSWCRGRRARLVAAAFRRRAPSSRGSKNGGELGAIPGLSAPVR